MTATLQVRQLGCRFNHLLLVLVARKAMVCVSEHLMSDEGPSEWVPAASWEAADALGTALLDEVELALGREGARAELESRLGALETDLTPLVAVMPKNEYGKLGPTAVRFALHRFFVRRHSWFVKGLETHGEAWNASSPTNLLKGHVSDHVRGLFERRLQRGLGVKGVALLAATFEYLVQHEAEIRLKAIYTIHGESLNSSISEATAETLLNTHMATMLLTIETQKLREHLHFSTSALMGQYHQAYPNHLEISRIISESSADHRSAGVGAPRALSYGDVAKILNVVLDRYGHWSGYAECTDLKNLLLKAEHNGTGCVRLSDFYGNSSVLRDAWQFQESPSFLRQLGALDESNPENPNVIVPNYIQGAGNCLATSSWYSLCCVNECEPLFQHIEQEIKAPEAFPAQLAAVVRKLPSPTVAAPRALSQGLLFHLHEIAWSHNDGMVPLHGRLFAQWMHHAYPRECPFPHPSGTTFPTFTGEVVSSEEKEELAQKLGARRSNAAPVQTCTPWRAEEEVLSIPHNAPPSLADLEADAHLWNAAQTIAIITAVVCMLLKTLHSAIAIKKKMKQTSPSLCA